MIRRILGMAVAVGLLTGLMACRETAKQEGGAGEPPRPLILSPEVGKTLEKAIQTPAVKAAVPQGWVLESVQVQARSIVVKVAGSDGAVAVVELKAQDLGGAEKGRWFAFDVPANPPGLKDLAMAVDAAFNTSPWSEPKREGIPPHPGEAPAPPPPSVAPQGGPPSVPPPAPSGEPPASPTPPGGGGPPAEAPAPAPQSKARPGPTPAWLVLASASAQVVAVVGVVGSVLYDEMRA